MSLLPCPFCGSPAVRLPVAKFVGCGNLDCFMQERGVLPEIWNTRTALAAAPGGAVANGGEVGFHVIGESPGGLFRREHRFTEHGANTLVAQWKLEFADEDASKILIYIRPLYTHPAPAAPEGFVMVPAKGWVPWRREWVGSFDRGWHIVEAKHLTNNNRVAYLGDALESGVDALIAAHNALGHAECREGCPPLTVCDTCQGVSAAPPSPSPARATEGTASDVSAFGPVDGTCANHPDGSYVMLHVTNGNQRQCIRVSKGAAETLAAELVGLTSPSPDAQPAGGEVSEAMVAEAFQMERVGDRYYLTEYGLDASKGPMRGVAFYSVAAIKDAAALLTAALSRCNCCPGSDVCAASQRSST